MGQRKPAARLHLRRLFSQLVEGCEGDKMWISKYVPVRVGASEPVRTEIEQSSDGLIRNYDCEGNETRTRKRIRSQISKMICSLDSKACVSTSRMA
jgi:hypothetical protein